MRTGPEPDSGDGAAGASGAAGDPPGGERRDDPLVVDESDALILFTHLVTSAELCLSEPWDYGSYRLLDAASRLAAAMLARGRSRPGCSARRPS
jgi:hypothetical protein